MTALPTTAGETNTQPWVSKRHSASHGFAELALGARSSARIGARLRSNKAATTANDRLRIRPPDECTAHCPTTLGRHSVRRGYFDVTIGDMGSIRRTGAAQRQHRRSGVVWRSSVRGSSHRAFRRSPSSCPVARRGTRRLATAPRSRRNRIQPGARSALLPAERRRFSRPINQCCVSRTPARPSAR